MALVFVLITGSGLRSGRWAEVAACSVVAVPAVARLVRPVTALHEDALVVRNTLRTQVIPIEEIESVMWFDRGNTMRICWGGSRCIESVARPALATWRSGTLFVGRILAARKIYRETHGWVRPQDQSDVMRGHPARFERAGVVAGAPHLPAERTYRPVETA